MPLKKYKHPFKNAPHYFLVQPGTKIVEGKTIREPGLSIPLIDFRFETNDPIIQELVEKDPLFHPGGIEIMTEKEKLPKIESGPQYETGSVRVIKKTK